MMNSQKVKAAVLACLTAAATATVNEAGFPTNGQPAENKAAEGPRMKEGEILIRFSPNAKNEHLQDALNRAAGRVLKHVQTGLMAQEGHPGVTRVATRLPVEQAMEALRNHPAVQAVEPNYIVSKLQTADPKAGWVIKDRFYGDATNPLWGMYGAGSDNVPGTTGAPSNQFGSQADEAWFLKYDGIFRPVDAAISETATPSLVQVVVGVIDEGISWRHPDLIANIGNPLDPVDGVDNDGNGKIDDSYGWDFISEDNSVFDPVNGYPDVDAHGTHVAGTIGAKANNSYTEGDKVYNNIGVAGVVDNVKIISGKFLGPEDGTTFDAIQAIEYFVDLKARGANVVALNNSWGGGPYSAELHAAIIRAAKADILFIAAAGNGDRFGRGINIDTYPTYPACYDTTVSAVSGGVVLESGAAYDAVISVAAIQADGRIATFSNYGAKNVDLAAPGHNIVSTYPWQVSVNAATWDPENCYMPYNGTSMAAPHVTGAAALYAAHYPEASPAAIKQSILNAARSTLTTSMNGKCVTGGRLNLVDIKNTPTEPPAGPTSAPEVPALTLTGVVKVKNGISVMLAWSNVEMETGYELQRSTISNFSSGVTTVQKGADMTSHTDSGLKSTVTYYYRVRAKNNIGASGWSSTVSSR